MNIPGSISPVSVPRVGASFPPVFLPGSWYSRFLNSKEKGSTLISGIKYSESSLFSSPGSSNREKITTRGRNSSHQKPLLSSKLKLNPRPGRRPPLGRNRLLPRIIKQIPSLHPLCEMDEIILERSLSSGCGGLPDARVSCRTTIGLLILR